MTDRSESSRTLWGDVAAWTLTGCAAGSLVGYLAARGNGSLVGAPDALRFLFLTSLAYGLLFTAFGLGAVLFQEVLGRVRKLDRSRRGGFHAHVARASFSYLAYCLGSFATASIYAWATEVHARSVGFGLIAAVLAAGLATIWAGVRDPARRAARWPSALVLGGLLLAPVLLVLQKPAPEAPREADTASIRIPEAPPQVLVIGVDGAEWSRIRPLMEAGRLPNLQRLCEGGETGTLETFEPTWSPIIWTTIATGQPASSHGIFDFTEIRLPGLDVGVQRLRVTERVQLNPLPTGPPLPPHTGVAPLIDRLVRAGYLEEQPIRSFHRRVPAVWNILSSFGLRVGVIRWWATWPAEEVNGFLVADDRPLDHARFCRSDGAATAAGTMASYPPDLFFELAKIESGFWDEPAWDEDDVEGSSAAALALPIFSRLEPGLEEALLEDWVFLRLALGVHQNDTFAALCARHLLENKDLDFLAVYFGGIDAVSHRIEDHAKADPRYLEVIDGYYESVDRMLGTFLDSAREGATVLLLSDHGWSYEPHLYGHYHAPGGVIVASGEGIEAGELVPNPTVHDLAPTILGLLGLPTSSEMGGRTLLAEPALERLGAETGRIRSFGPYEPVWPMPVEGVGSAAREQALEHLRELGYVQ